MNEIYENIIKFLDQFVDTYLSSNIPDDATFPRASFDVSIQDWDSVSLLTISIYDKGQDPTRALNIAQSIADAVGTGYAFGSENYGYTLDKGSPLCQLIPTDDRTIHVYMVFALRVINR